MNIFDGECKIVGGIIVDLRDESIWKAIDEAEVRAWEAGRAYDEMQFDPQDEGWEDE